MVQLEIEKYLESRLAGVRERLQLAQFEMRRVREEMEALDAEDFGLRRTLADLRGEDPSTIRRRPSPTADEAARLTRIRLMELERNLEAEEARSRGARSETSFTASPPVTPSGAERRRNRGDAVEEILNQADRPLDRREILTRLTAAGRPDDNLDGVSATLSHLRRTKRAISVDGGWTTPQRYQVLTAPAREGEAVERTQPNADDPSQDGTRGVMYLVNGEDASD